MSKQTTKDLDAIFGHRAPFGTQVKRYEELRTKYRELAVLALQYGNDSPELDDAIWYLDLSLQRTIASIARYEKATTYPFGMNFSAVTEWMTEIPFNDLTKEATPFYSQVEGTKYDEGKKEPLVVDVKGYPIKLNSDKHFAESLTLVNMNGHVPSGGFMLTWEGDGTLEVSGMASGAATTNLLVITLDPAKADYLSIRIRKTNPDNYVRGITLRQVGLGALLFRPDFVAKYQGKYQIGRFMNWCNVNDSEVMNPEDLPLFGRYSEVRPSGVNYQYIIAAASNLNLSPWICVPHLATDATVLEIANRLKESVNAGFALPIYIEHSNECWNTMFKQALYCRTRGIADKLATDPYEAQIKWYSQRSIEVLRIFKKVLGDQAKGILAVHHDDLRTGRWALEWKDAYKEVEAIATAPYWGHAIGSKAKAAWTIASTPEVIFAECLKDINAKKVNTVAYVALAKAKGLKIFTYESGQHLKPEDENDTKLAEKLMALNRHPGMKALYTQDIKNWRDAGGDVFTIFSSVSRYNKYGSWGVLEYFDQQTSPKLEAIKEMMQS